MKWERQMELYRSLRELVMEEQWSVEGWIHEKNVSIYELDDTLGLAAAALNFFDDIALRKLDRDRSR